MIAKDAPRITIKEDVVVLISIRAKYNKECCLTRCSGCVCVYIYIRDLI